MKSSGQQHCVQGGHSNLRALQSINDLSSGFIWVAAVTFIAASDQDDSSGFHICWVVFCIPHARNGEEQQNTSFPISPEPARLGCVPHRHSEQRQQQPPATAVPSTHSLAVPPSDQTEASLPHPQEKPIPPAAAFQTQTAAAHGDGEPKTPPSFSDKLCSLT